MSIMSFSHAFDLGEKYLEWKSEHWSCMGDDVVASCRCTLSCPHAYTRVLLNFNEILLKYDEILLLQCRISLTR